MVVRPQIQATLLTIIAGISDAVGYISGGVFAANMTGNTVLAGIALAESRYPDAGRHLAPLVAFFIGAMLARLLLGCGEAHDPHPAGSGDHRRHELPADRLRARRWSWPCDGPAGLGHHPVRRRSVSTVVTSTPARTADAALDHLWPAEGAQAAGRRHAAPADADLVGYLVGAVAGGLLLHVVAWPLLVPAVLLVIVVLP